MCGKYSFTFPFIPSMIQVTDWTISNGGYNIDVDEINAAMEKYGGKVVVTG